MPRNLVSVSIIGGWLESQLLFVIPIALGYVNQTSDVKIILDSPESVEKIAPLFARGGDRVIAFDHIHNYKSLVPTIKKLQYLVRAIIIGLTTNRRNLLSAESMELNSYRHAFWDSAWKRQRDGDLMMGYLSYARLRGIYQLYTGLKYSNIVSNLDLKACFLGHTVYDFRVVLMALRKRKIPTFAHMDYKIYRIDPDCETNAHTLRRSEWQKYFSIVKDDEVNSYWIQRTLGNTAYDDAKNAFEAAGGQPPLGDYNLLMLHVFRDSPFNYIDRERIFADYLSWFAATLCVLRRSQERWLIKIHPSAGRWGEDQLKWVEATRCLVMKNTPLKIEIISNETSNLELIENCKKIVTYSGTSHVEAACLGKRPIIISGVGLFTVCPTLVFKPSNIEEYTNLLLRPYKDCDHKLSSSQIDLAKRYLFVVEEVFSMYRTIGGVRTYKGDSSEIFERDFQEVLSRIEGNLKFLKNIGEGFSKDLTLSMAPDFLGRLTCGEKVVLNPLEECKGQGSALYSEASI